MSTSYPPPTPPPKRNNAWLAVIVGILVVLLLIVGFGVFIIARFVHSTHIVTTGSGAHKVTNIQSPLGNLHVEGEGNNAHVSIHSPFGSLQVEPQPDLAQLDMTIYPGATQVVSKADSAFAGGDDLQGVFSSHHGGVELDGPGAEVRMRGPGGAMMINVAEFRTAASPSQVLDFYRQQLDRFGSVQFRRKGRTESLKFRRSDTDVRYIAVRTAGDGTHFVLVRAKSATGSDAAR